MARRTSSKYSQKYNKRRPYVTSPAKTRSYTLPRENQKAPQATINARSKPTHRRFVTAPAQYGRNATQPQRRRTAIVGKAAETHTEPHKKCKPCRPRRSKKTFDTMPSGILHAIRDYSRKNGGPKCC